MFLLPFLQARLASVSQTASLYLAVDAEVGAAGGEGKGRMTLAATAKGRELDPYYMVITNNYRLERGRRERRKKRACAVDGRARAVRRTSCPSRCPESHAYVVIRES